MSVELIGGSCPSLQQLPIGSLKVMGCNPYGEPIFRVVWSESRYYMVGAAHREYDGDPASDKVLRMRGKDPNLTKEHVGYKWLPLYPGPGRWVLEMWKSPMGFTGCTKEQYELMYRDPVTNLITLGPYPSRGEYVQCSVQLSPSPGREEILRKIELIKAGWNYSYAEKESANRAALEKSEKDKFNTFKDMFKDAQQAFNNNPSSVRPGKRTKEKYEIKVTAEEAGLARVSGFNAGTPRTPRRQHARNRRTA